MQNEFEYTPLSSDVNAIRLLHVQPADSNNVVKCLMSDSIVGRDDYIALSHVWGEETATFQIEVDGNAFWIRPNLFAFLRHAQAHLRNTYLWIDAICVDQSNIEEKNRQIPLMGQIFANAREVTAWLQPPAGLVLSASFSDINLLGSAALAKRVSQQDSDFFRQGGPVRGALTRLVEHPFWTRLWIVQELLLSRSATICWEGQSFDFADLKASLAALVPRTDLPQLLVNSPFYVLLTADKLDASPAQKRPLVELVINHRWHSCSVPFDHVFALLGLASTDTPLEPDYTESPFSLIAKVALTSKVPVEAEEFAEICEILSADLSMGFPMQIFALPVSDHPGDQPQRGKLLFAWCPSCREVTMTGERKGMMLVGLPKADVFYLVEAKRLRGLKVPRDRDSFAVRTLARAVRVDVCNYNYCGRVEQLGIVHILPGCRRSYEGAWPKSAMMPVLRQSEITKASDSEVRLDLTWKQVRDMVRVARIAKETNPAPINMNPSHKYLDHRSRAYMLPDLDAAWVSKHGRAKRVNDVSPEDLKFIQPIWELWEILE